MSILLILVEGMRSRTDQRTLPGVLSVAIGWDVVTRKVPHRWALLVIICVVMYIIVDVLSNRTPLVA